MARAFFNQSENVAKQNQSKHNIVGSLRAEKRSDRAFLRTVTKLGTDVPWVTPNRFRRGAPKFHYLGGGEGQYCPTHSFGYETVNWELFGRVIFR